MKLKPEFRKQRKVGSQVEPDDMRNNFINASTFIGNIVLFVFLVMLIGLVKSNTICPPPHSILNPDYLTPAYQLHCGYKNITNTTSTYLNTTLVSHLNEDDYPNFSKLYYLTFMIIVPLGLTSLVLATSKAWMSKIQDADQIVRLQYRFKWFATTMDSLKAVMAFVLYAVFLAYLFPVAIGLSNLTEQCHTTPWFNITYPTWLLLVMGLILWLDVKKVSQIRCRVRQQNIEEPTDPKERFIIAMVSTILTVVGLILILLQILNALPPSFQDESCNSTIRGATIYLAVLNGITFALISLLAIYYFVAWLNKNRSNDGDDEMETEKRTDNAAVGMDAEAMELERLNRRND